MTWLEVSPSVTGSKVFGRHKQLRVTGDIMLLVMLYYVISDER